MQHQWISTAITIAVIALVFTLRFRSVGRDRPLKLERLWIVPAIYILAAGFAFWRMPPHGMIWLWCAIAFALGAALGWYRGKMVAISVDPETHELNQRASMASMLFIFAIVIIRMSARGLAMEMHLGAQAVLVLTDILIAFALGLMPVQRLEMGLRASRLLRSARAA